MWYLVIRTDVGRLDLSSLNIFYSEEAEAEQWAEKVRAMPDTIEVEICRK